MLRVGPLRLHWSLLLGAALFCALQPRPLLLAGYAAALAAHVGGHAIALAGAPPRGRGGGARRLGGGRRALTNAGPQEFARGMRGVALVVLRALLACSSQDRGPHELLAAGRRTS